jgi:ketosteroid isomerase-like protein
MRRLAPVAVCLAVLAVACKPAAAPLSDTDIAAVKQLGQSYAQAVLAGNADSVVALYAEDAVEMPPNRPVRVGKAAIKAGYGVGGTSAFAITSAQIDGRSDLAFDRGTWSWTGMMPGQTEPTSESGSYLVIARRQAGGSWLWTDVIWNSDTPLPGMP